MEGIVVTDEDHFSSGKDANYPNEQLENLPTTVLEDSFMKSIPSASILHGSIQSAPIEEIVPSIQPSVAALSAPGYFPQNASDPNLFGSAVTVDETSANYPVVPRGDGRSRSNTPASGSQKTPVKDSSGRTGQLPTVLSGDNWNHFGSATILPGMESGYEVKLTDILAHNTSGGCDQNVKCAWIPSERTNGAIQAIAAAIPPSDFLGSDQLTKPSIQSDRLFVNPAFDLALRLVGTIPPSLVPDNPDEMLNRGDLRGLLEKGFYTSAANLTAKLFSSLQQGYGQSGNQIQHSPESLMIWYCRLASLVLSDQVDLASREMEAFGDLDNPDLYFDYYTDYSSKGLSGSMVPFEFRLLHAQLPQLQGTARVTLDRLHAIRGKIEKMLLDDSKGQTAGGNQQTSTFQNCWQLRRRTVLFLIVRAATQSEDFDTAISLLVTLMQLLPEKACRLWHSMGVLQCHIGTPKMARLAFEASENLLPTGSAEYQYLVLLHQALLTICEGSVVQSLDLYRQLFAADSRDSAAANAIAVALMYSGRMSEAMVFLENLVMNQPKVFLNNQSIINLAAMYDLHSIHTRTHKLRILSLICQHMPDGHGVAHLKLGMTEA